MVWALSWVPGDGCQETGASPRLAQLTCFILLEHGVFGHRIETKIPRPLVAVPLPEGRTEMQTMQEERTSL